MCSGKRFESGAKRRSCWSICLAFLGQSACCTLEKKQWRLLTCSPCSTRCKDCFSSCSTSHWTPKCCSTCANSCADRLLSNVSAPASVPVLVPLPLRNCPSLLTLTETSRFPCRLRNSLPTKSLWLTSRCLWSRRLRKLSQVQFIETPLLISILELKVVFPNFAIFDKLEKFLLIFVEEYFEFQFCSRSNLFLKEAAIDCILWKLNLSQVGIL